MFWKNIGKVLASIGKYSLQGALWASQHPEVVAKVSEVALQVGAKPDVVAKVDQGVAIATEAVNTFTSTPKSN